MYIINEARPAQFLLWLLRSDKDNICIFLANFKTGNLIR